MRVADRRHFQVEILEIPKWIFRKEVGYPTVGTDFVRSCFYKQISHLAALQLTRSV